MSLRLVTFSPGLDASSTLTTDPPDQGLEQHLFPRTSLGHLCSDEDGLGLSFPPS